MAYIKGVTECWKCKQRIPVFTWPEHVMFAQECPEEGRPETLKLAYSKTLEGEYWVNTCACCGAIQGDWFLYCEPEGPFFGVEVTEKQNS